MRNLFRRRIRHPFYPALKPAPAAAVKSTSASLYGGFADLAAAAASGIRVERAVFPLVAPTTPFLDPGDRDELWSKFRVPVYALLVDGGDDVIGYECEAQSGLHLREDYAARLLFGRVDATLCECGRPGPRLVPDNWDEQASAAFAFESREQVQSGLPDL